MGFDGNGYTSGVSVPVTAGSLGDRQESAVDRLRAAVGVLERLKADSAPGPWEKRYVLGMADWPVVISDGIGAEWAAGVSSPEHDAELIVTLHRTIDAQLAFLRSVHGARGVEKNWATLDTTRRALALADAILGGAE